MRIRFRLARWLLGYAPVNVPEDEGTYIVIRSGKPEDRYKVTMIVTAETFKLDMTTPVRSLDMDGIREPYRPGGTTGTFSGTIHTVPDSPREIREVRLDYVTVTSDPSAPGRVLSVEPLQKATNT
jgi:hypothetical protein